MKHPFVWIVTTLVAVAAAMVAYRVAYLGYSLLPSGRAHGWRLALEAELEPSGERVDVRIGFPTRRPGQTVIGQEFENGRLKFNLTTDGPNRFGDWSGRARGRVTIGYRAALLSHPPAASSKPPKLPPYPAWADAAQQKMLERLAAPWLTLPVAQRLRVVGSVVRGNWSGPQRSEEDLAAWTAMQHLNGKGGSLRALYRAAGVPARPVHGFELRESASATMQNWLEVWNGERWQNVIPASGTVAPDGALMPLVIGDVEPMRAFGAKLDEVRWEVTHEVLNEWQAPMARVRGSENFLDRWSLFQLPEESQDTFHILILVPLGALLISVLRNVVGFQTFGIFMPVLMALAFRNTGLLYGLALFTAIVLIGFTVRRWVNQLRLLLVPRLSLILTLVVMCVLVLALIGNKFGKRELMAVGLLPFVILTMTIERFYVIHEEAGAKAALKAALGSAIVAVITFLILHYEPLQFVFFVYPELLLVVAAMQMLLGRYTGYRLSELYRFRNIRTDADV